MLSSVQLLKSEKRTLFKSRLQQIRCENPGLDSVDSSFANLLLSLNIYGENQIIASYKAMKGEISPALFEQKCPKLVRFVFPQFRDQKMIFVSSGGSWEIGPWPHFFQPAGRKSKPVQKIDIFLVPGLAFDREGRRLGRGGGWYDRFLAQSRGLKIGLAHTCQISNSPLPEESHDVRMDVVVTESYLLVPIRKNTDFLNQMGSAIGAGSAIGVGSTIGAGSARKASGTKGILGEVFPSYREDPKQELSNMTNKQVADIDAWDFYNLFESNMTNKQVADIEDRVTIQEHSCGALPPWGRRNPWGKQGLPHGFRPRLTGGKG